MKKILKYGIWLLCTVVVCNLGLYLFGIAGFSGAFDKEYSSSEAIQNFREREKEILDLADYFRKNKPDNHEVFFSAKGRRFDLSIGLPGWAVTPNFPNKNGSDLKVNTSESDSLLSAIGWSNATVTGLTERLKKANCLSITSNETTLDVHYRTGTWSSFSYMVSQKPFSDSLKKVYDEAQILLLSDNVKLATATAL